jgi:hypothetical protein
LCFVLSGAAALVYQVAWQRILALTTGVSVHSIAAITAAFMAGLGIGSHWGGVWSERLKPRPAVRAFAAVELGIALFAVLSVPLYYNVLYRGLPGLYDNPVVAFFTHFASLLIPTTLMGMSLPFLTRGLVISTAEAPRTIGFLYGANALGASFGAFLTPWALLRFLGVDGAVFVGAGLSACAALGAFAISRNVEDWAAEPLTAPNDGSAHGSRAPGARATGAAEPAQPYTAWILLYALSGFVSLSLEIVWFRILDVLAKGAAFTFGTLLGVYLLGLALGSFAATTRAPRIGRPLRAFLLCQAGIVAWTLFGFLVLVRLPPSWPGVEWLIAYGTRPVGVNMFEFSWPDILVMYGLLPIVLFGPATFLMGFGFPILHRAVQGDPRSSGRRVGFLQAANIAGCTLGSLVTGLALFPTLGSAGILRALGALGALVAVIGAARLRSKPLSTLAATTSLLVAGFPGNDALWLRLHGAPNPNDSFVGEDAASVNALTPRRPTGYTLWISGRTNSWLPFGSIHTTLGALPALVHPNPKDIAIVGLGSGDTAWAAGVREETENITVFEIATTQPKLLARIASMPKMTRLQEFLADRRVSVVADDGRRRLERDRKLYDIVEADAIYPDSGLSGHLYSVEFYELAARALKQGGIMCAWVPTPRSRASARRSFPHVLDFGDLLVLSNEPLALDPATWVARARSARAREYLGPSRIGELVDTLARGRGAAALDPYAEVNRDLQPRDEYVRPPRARR